MSVIVGTKEATLQPIKFGWSRERGHFTTKTWRGGEAQVRAQIPVVLAAGGSWEIEQQNGDIWQITAQYAQPQSDGAGGGDAGGEQIAVNWELAPKDAQKPLLASQFSLVAGLTPGEIKSIKANLALNIEPNSVTPGLGTNALKVYKLLQADVDTVEIEQPVLSLTWIVPDNVSLAYSYAFIGRIYTTTSLISAEAIPSYISASMTLWTASFVNPSFGTGRVALIFGWKKRAPTQRLAGPNKREISQTWEFGLWSTDIYGATV